MGNERFLSTAQTMRADQLKMTHKSLSALTDATANAIKYHDKYVAALDTLMVCLLDCSDAVEQTRALFGPSGAASIPPTFEVTGQLAGSFETWKGSPELLKVRHDLDELSETCLVAKRNVKSAEKKESKVEDCAARRAKDAAHLERRSEARYWSASTRRKKGHFDALSGEMKELDADLILTMKTDGAWWAGRLAALSRMFADDTARLGGAAIRCFAPQQSAPRDAPQPAASALPAQGWSSAAPHTVSDDSPYGTATYVSSPPRIANGFATGTPYRPQLTPRPHSQSGAPSTAETVVCFRAAPPLFGNLIAAATASTDHSAAANTPHNQKRTD